MDNSLQRFCNSHRLFALFNYFVFVVFTFFSFLFLSLMCADYRAYAPATIIQSLLWLASLLSVSHCRAVLLLMDHSCSAYIGAKLSMKHLLKEHEIPMLCNSQIWEKLYVLLCDVLKFVCLFVLNDQHNSIFAGMRFKPLLKDKLGSLTWALWAFDTKPLRLFQTCGITWPLFFCFFFIVLKTLLSLDSILLFLFLWGFQQQLIKWSVQSTKTNKQNKN